MKAYLAQLNPTVGAIEQNYEKIISEAEKASGMGANLFICPELALTGYPPLDLLKRKDFLELVSAHILYLRMHLPKDILAIIGAPHGEMISSQERLFSAAYVFNGGKIIRIIKKTLLPTYDVFDEARYFTPNNEKPSVIKYMGEKIGITICEDIWNDEKLNKKRRYESDPLEALMKKKPSIVVNISASPWEANKPIHRGEMVLHATRRWKIKLIYVNQVGGNDTLIFDGRSFVADSKTMSDCLPAYEECARIVDLEKPQYLPPDYKSRSEDLFCALSLGIRDYFHKLGFSKALIGLSGGIDSALVATLAVNALGNENVLGVLMPSEYSSKHSVDDSISLAKNLKIKTLTLPITTSFSAMKTILREGVSSSELDEEMKKRIYEEDVTEENLQSRIRGMLLMGLSNKYGYLMLATGNKSEMSTGYATLYGDMCGALAPLGDVYKTEVFSLCEYINEKEEVIPSNILTKPPSAELRPNQKDEDSLPPYNILDGILQAYVERKESIEEIARQYPIRTVRWVVNTLHKNEYKRQQAPPILKVGKKALRPGRMFPIVQHFHTK